MRTILKERISYLILLVCAVAAAACVFTGCSTAKADSAANTTEKSCSCCDGPVCNCEDMNP